MDELCLSCHLAVPENAFECGTCRKWVHYSCTQLPTYMIYQLTVILTDVEYKCEFCILSPGQVVSDKFMEIDLAISTQKSLGNGGLLNDSDTTGNNVDQPPPANDAPITNGDTGPLDNHSCSYMNDQLVIHLTTATCPTGNMVILSFQYLKIARF